MTRWLKIAIWSLLHRLRPEWYAQIDPCAKCPACGHRSGAIATQQTKEGAQVVHRCLICDAAWAEPTIVEPSLWLAR